MPARWYFDCDGRQGGPVTVAELKQMADVGQLRPTDKVRKEDMDHWVKARSVRGLFTPVVPPPMGLDDAPLATPAEPASDDGGSVFDFFGAEPAPAAAPEVNPAFDFFGPGGANTPAPAGPANPAFDFAAPPPAAPAPPPPAAPKATRKPKPPAAPRPPVRPKAPAPTKAALPPSPPPVAPVVFEPFAAAEEGGSFQFAAPAEPPPAAAVEGPAPFAGFQAETAPQATPAGDVFAFAATAPAARPVTDKVPLAAPVADAGPAGAVLAKVSGPAVELLPDELMAPTGGRTVLELTAGWLAARTVLPDGLSRETYLRLARLEAAALGGRRRSRAGREAPAVLSFHAGGQAVAVLCEGDAAPYRAFLKRVLAQAQG
jgi:hypothetical protein